VKDPQPAGWGIAGAGELRGCALALKIPTCRLGDYRKSRVRGKDFVYTVVYPDCKSDVILNMPKYDFNWQLTYELKKPLFLPRGSRLDCVAHFDNSTKNKFNPDATKEVSWGPQTWEEMMIGWYTTVRYLNPADKPDVASR